MSSEKIGFIVITAISLIFLILSYTFSPYFYIISYLQSYFGFMHLQNLFSHHYKSIFKKKIKHLIQENGSCEIYFDNGKIWKKFNLTNGLFDGKYESLTIHGSESLTLNFKNGVLHGQSSMFSTTRNCYEYIEKFENGVLISKQTIRKTTGHDPLTLLGRKYELGPVITDKKILEEKGSSIKNQIWNQMDLMVKLKTQKRGVKYKLYIS